jgi:hypothetical protein
VRRSLDSFQPQIFGDWCERKYDCLMPIYTTSYTIPLSQHTNKHQMSPLFDYGIDLKRAIKFSGVMPNEDNVWRSIYKMDYEPEIRISDMDCWRRGIQKTEETLEFCLKRDVEVYPEFVLKTSATFPFQTLGYRTKGDVLNDADFYNWVWDPFNKITWTRVSPKYEYLSLEEILNEGKIRTFLVAPMHLLYWQKAFGIGDEYLKKFQPGWIRYGITFQYGGFHRMIMAHACGGTMEDLMDRIFVEKDISGWDRRLPLLDEVWRIRRKFLNVPAFLEPYYEWMVKNTVESYLLLPNGDVVKKKWGNNSGSGTTTGDNCIAHQEIEDYFQEKMRKYYHLEPELYHADIMGDDSLDSLPDGVIDRDVLKKMVIDHYGEFDLLIKPSAFAIRKGPIGCHFLGAECVLVDNTYFVPAYDSERIYAAFVTMINEHNMDEEVSKCYALMHLAWNDKELFDQLRAVILRVMADESVSGPFIESIRVTGVPTRDNIVYGFWIGTEGFFDNFLAPDHNLYGTWDRALNFVATNE